MRIGGLSLLGLLAALVIVALLAAHALGHASIRDGATPGTSMGGYANAISAAQRSVAHQNAAAGAAATGAP